MSLPVCLVQINTKTLNNWRPWIFSHQVSAANGCQSRGCHASSSMHHPVCAAGRQPNLDHPKLLPYGTSLSKDFNTRWKASSLPFPQRGQVSTPRFHIRFPPDVPYLFIRTTSRFLSSLSLISRTAGSGRSGINTEYYVLTRIRREDGSRCSFQTPAFPASPMSHPNALLASAPMGKPRPDLHIISHILPPLVTTRPTLENNTTRWVLLCNSEHPDSSS